MLSEAEIDAAAADLLTAETARTQIGLLSRRHPAMTMDDAYRVQDRLIAAKLAQGRRIIGWKIGLTSKAMQSALNITTPDSGVLLDDMAFEDGAPAPERLGRAHAYAVARGAQEGGDAPDPADADAVSVTVSALTHA